MKMSWILPKHLHLRVSLFAQQYTCAPENIRKGPSGKMQVWILDAAVSVILSCPVLPQAHVGMKSTMRTLFENETRLCLIKPLDSYHVHSILKNFVPTHLRMAPLHIVPIVLRLEQTFWHHFNLL